MPYVMHSAKGTTWGKKNAKYKKKEKINGKWKYFYNLPIDLLNPVPTDDSRKAIREAKSDLEIEENKQKQYEKKLAKEIAAEEKKQTAFETDLWKNTKLTPKKRDHILGKKLIEYGLDMSRNAISSIKDIQFIVDRASNNSIDVMKKQIKAGMKFFGG